MTFSPWVRAPSIAWACSSSAEPRNARRRFRDEGSRRGSAHTVPRRCDQSTEGRRGPISMRTPSTDSPIGSETPSSSLGACAHLRVWGVRWGVVPPALKRRTASMCRRCSCFVVCVCTCVHCSPCGCIYAAGWRTRAHRNSPLKPQTLC